MECITVLCAHVHVWIHSNVVSVCIQHAHVHACTRAEHVRKKGAWYCPKRGVLGPKGVFYPFRGPKTLTKPRSRARARVTIHNFREGTWSESPDSGVPGHPGPGRGPDPPPGRAGPRGGEAPQAVGPPGPKAPHIHRP